MSPIETLTAERDRLAAVADEWQIRVNVSRAILTAHERELRKARKAAQAAMNALSDAWDKIPHE